MSRAGTLHEVPTVSAAALLERDDAVVVDLRSPAEFAEDHVPGATNVPLLDDVERALVGRLYKRESPEAAFGAARGRVAARLGELVEGVFAAAGEAPPEGSLEELYAGMTAAGIEQLDASLRPTELARAPARPVVLHCWRGGLRSRSVIAFVRALGLERAVGLARGYKGYRASVRAELDAWRAPDAVVLRGLTGVGKTLILRELECLRPSWTVDLEGLAGHRSSILGRVGLAPVSQKTFESRLAERLRAGFAGPAVFEGESRKVGDVIIPARVWTAMEGARSIELVADAARRVEVLLDDYLGREENRAELREKLPFIEARLGQRWAGRLVGLLDGAREAELAALLLEHYYDPLYRHSGARHRIDARIDASDPQRAAREIAAWIEST